MVILVNNPHGIGNESNRAYEYWGSHEVDHAFSYDLNPLFICEEKEGKELPADHCMKHMQTWIQPYWYAMHVSCCYTKERKKYPFNIN